jgi:hypothetical protein
MGNTAEKHVTSGRIDSKSSNVTIRAKKQVESLPTSMKGVLSDFEEIPKNLFHDYRNQMIGRMSGILLPELRRLISQYVGIHQCWEPEAFQCLRLHNFFEPKVHADIMKELNRSEAEIQTRLDDQKLEWTFVPQKPFLHPRHLSEKKTIEIERCAIICTRESIRDIPFLSLNFNSDRSFLSSSSSSLVGIYLKGENVNRAILINIETGQWCSCTDLCGQRPRRYQSFNRQDMGSDANFPLKIRVEWWEEKHTIRVIRYGVKKDDSSGDRFIYVEEQRLPESYDPKLSHFVFYCVQSEFTSDDIEVYYRKPEGVIVIDNSVDK